MTECIHDELHLKTNGIRQNLFINLIALCFKHTLNTSGASDLFFSIFYSMIRQCSDKE